MIKKKAIICTILLAIIVGFCVVRGHFLTSDIIKLSISHFILSLIGAYKVGEWTTNFYKWLIKDEETK